MHSLSEKIKYLGILLFALIGWHVSLAQAPLLDHKVTFSSKSYSLYELTHSIEKQMDVSFSYNSKTISSSKRIILKNRITDLKSVLYLLKKEYGINAKMSGNHVILVMDKSFRPEKQAPKKRKKENKKLKKKKNNLAVPSVETEDPDDLFAPATGAIPASDSASFVTDLLAADSSLSQSPSSGGGGSGAADDAERTSKYKLANHIRQKGVAVAGAYTDESFYINPFVAIGYQYLSAHLVYAFRSDLSHWRYGGAVRVPVGKRLDLSLFGNYGKMNRPVSYSYSDTVLIPGDPDSPVVISIHEGTINTKGKLFKIGITASYNISEQLSFSVSPVINFLSTTYYRDNIPTPLIDIIPQPAIIREEDFELFRTRFNLNSDFNPGEPTYRKTWVGLQIGLTYHFLKRKNQEK